MSEKCTAQIVLRLPESLALSLYALADRDERALAEYLRIWLDRHVNGHGGSLAQPGRDANEIRASERIPHELGGSRSLRD